MVTFPVSNVERCQYASPSASLVDAVEFQVGAPVEACAANLGDLIVHDMHPLIAAAHVAFTRHAPLVLSPDDVWLAIAQGLGAHVRANAESLRARLGRFPGKRTIEVRRDEFVKGSPDNDWPGCFAGFSDAIARGLGKKRDLVVGSFSTTGPVEKAAFEVALMNVMSHYYDYRVVTLCGIPEITLLGTPDDWQSIRDRAHVLAELDLEWWCRALEPVLDEFVTASRGSVDVDFWRSLYKSREGSGGPWVTGWINAFFPFLARSTVTTTCRNKFAVRWQSVKHDQSFTGAPTPVEFPHGLAAVPFVWEYLVTNFEMELLGGFVGVSQDPKTLAVRPAIGWAVRDPEAD